MRNSRQGPRLFGFAESSRWIGAEPPWAQSSPASLTIHAPAVSDRFFDPASSVRRANSPAWISPIEAPATLVARVSVDFQATFDAGVMMVFHHRDRWAKLCFERAPSGQPMVVSVVTKGRSDDANAFEVAVRALWLRITALGTAYAFHASPDGERWQLVRLFDLGQTTSPQLGVSAQAPLGDGCTVTFDDVSLRPGAVSDVRGED